MFRSVVKWLKMEISVLRCDFSNMFWPTPPLAHPGRHYWSKRNHVPLKLLLTSHEQLQSYLFLSATKPPVCRTIKRWKCAASNLTDTAWYTLTTTWFEIIFFTGVCCHRMTDNIVFIDTTESNLTNKTSEDSPVLKDFYAGTCHVRLKREMCYECCRRVKTKSISKTKLPVYLQSWVTIKYLHFYICIYSVTVVTKQFRENYKCYSKVNFCSC